MASIEQFRRMITSLDAETLGGLCEQFVYDHDGAVASVINFSEKNGFSIGCEEVKDFVTEMHIGGEFDHVECWGTPLGTNDLYKKFHP
tara:strand:- start:61 stop:324 length:264 start_codon:yes stop_codon:yes gene_type:complete